MNEHKVTVPAYSRESSCTNKGVCAPSSTTTENKSREIVIYLVATRGFHRHSSLTKSELWARQDDGGGGGRGRDGVTSGRYITSSRHQTAKLADTVHRGNSETSPC